MISSLVVWTEVSEAVLELLGHFHNTLRSVAVSLIFSDHAGFITRNHVYDVSRLETKAPKVRAIREVK